MCLPVAASEGSTLTAPFQGPEVSSQVSHILPVCSENS